MSAAQRQRMATTAKTTQCRNRDCRAEFIVKRKTQRYCSRSCRQQGYFQRKLAKTKPFLAHCPACGHEFPVQIAAIA
jgi:hypothetical protein